MAKLSDIRRLSCSAIELNVGLLKEFIEPLQEGTILNIETQYGTGQRGDEMRYDITAKLI